ncbi:MAG: VWA domain-containing protein [Anaerolineae bacterium]|nr:VWA domain-containing protein [Anaerolineae bacterium]
MRPFKQSQSPPEPDNQPHKGCGSCAVGCFILWLLTIVLLCGGLLWLTSRTVGAAAARLPLAVWLLIDNSNSTFEMGGVGSDPDLLRMDAARLFLTYLGVDERGLTHQAGVIFFGSTAETAVPLTPLTDDEQRAQLFAQIANPPRMGWTDHLAALTMAQEQLATLTTPHYPAIIMLTDGKGEWADSSTQNPIPEEQTAYITALRQKSQELADADIPLFIILLANEVTDADPDIAAIWQPLWQEMSAANPSGRFYVARTADQLPDIYHDIVVALTERQTAGVVLDTAVTGHSLQTLEIPAGLAQITLVIRKSSPTQTITIQTPGQVTLAEDLPFARHAGGHGAGDAGREEIWVIEQPPPGMWTLRLDGSGQITIWQDYLPAPTPVPVPTVLATATITSPPVHPTAVATIAATVTAAPSPTTTRAVIAPATSLDKPIMRPPDTSTPGPRWPWAAAGVVLTGMGTAVLYWRRQRQRPCVTGLLRLAEGHTTIDLDGLNRPVITVGQPPADVPIPGATARAIIRPGASLGDAHEILISGRGDLRVNGRPVTGETNLADTAVIHLGNGVQARYENLRLRRAWREAVSSKQ